MNRPQITSDITRGIRRFLLAHNISSITELTLKNGRRVDIMGLDDKGKITIIEVKSSKEDFLSDQKWEEYLPYCDAFYFAVSETFPTELLPQHTGLIIADSYDAEILRPAISGDLNPARRKAVTLRFAHLAARKNMVDEYDG